MKKFVQISVCFSLLFAVSCKEKNKTADKATTNANSPQIENVTTPVKQNQTAPVDGKYAVMTFKEPNYKFGEIKEGEIVTHDFVFTNTGEVPLIITSAVGSCGCTVPAFPKEPIAPGGSGIIKVQFNSTGFEGEKNKTVTIEANTENKSETIGFSANIKKK